MNCHSYFIPELIEHFHLYLRGIIIKNVFEFFSDCDFQWRMIKLDVEYIHKTQVHQNY